MAVLVFWRWLQSVFGNLVGKVTTGDAKATCRFSLGAFRFL